MCLAVGQRSQIELCSYHVFLPLRLFPQPATKTDNDPIAFTIDLHSIEGQLLLFTANREIYLPITIARKSIYLFIFVNAANNKNQQ